MNPPLPKEEPERLKALQDFEILDSPLEEGFDRLTRLASGIFGVPIAAISMIDRDRLWFKSSVGLEFLECPREGSFCAHAILGAGVLVIEDARLDARFVDHPLVTGPPRICFYAAAPLISSEGLRLGTLCILDREPRKFLESEGELLTDLAAVVVDRLEVRRSVHQSNSRGFPRQVGRIFADMSHEIRTPLNSVLGFSRLLQSGPTLSDRQRQFIEAINRNGEHLLSMIDDVLEMSRLEAGQSSLHLAPCAVAGVVREVGMMFQGMAEEQGLELALAISPEFPPCVLADETKLRQVLINLVGNAVKFTEEGRIELRVSSKLRGEGGVWLEFEVADSGIGLKESELERIFDAFEQAADGAQRAAGTGLGLAISREQVRLMGGELRVESTTGEGSVFRFEIHAELPSASESDLPALEATGSGQPVALVPRDQGTRVLIVEDNEGNRSVLANLLRPLGFELREATNGREAIDSYAEFNPRIILMDLRMPELNGVEAIRRIRGAEQAPGAPLTIIGVSASVSEEEAGLMLAAGCDTFVRKPFRSATLLNTIAEHSGIEYQFAAGSGKALSPP